MRKLLILVSAVAFVFAFTLPAAAAEWSFYGSARMFTAYEDATPASTVPDTEADSATDLYWYLQSNSRIGANVTTDGPISGHFEYGSTPNLRILSATWNFGAGSLLVGQDYSPVDSFYSSSCGKPSDGGDCGLVGYGTLYTGRVAQIKLMYGPLQVAFIEPSATAIGTDVDTETSIPEIEASYSFNVGPVALKPVLGFGSYDSIDAADHSNGISSTVLGIGGTYATGPVKVFFTVYTATNAGNLGLLQFAKGATSAAYNVAGTDIEDASSMALLIGAGYQVNPTMGLEVGYSMLNTEQDDVDVTGETTEYSTTTYYINATIALAKGFLLVPEIGMVDFGDKEYGSTSIDQGEATYYGAKWHVNF
jgi:hypothetical protein